MYERESSKKTGKDLQGLNLRRRGGVSGYGRIPNQEYKAVPLDLVNTRSLAKEVGFHEGIDLHTLMPPDLKIRSKSVLGDISESTTISLIKEALESVKLIQEHYSIFDAQGLSEEEKMGQATRIGDTLLSSNAESSSSYIGATSEPFALVATGDMGRKEMLSHSKLDFGLVGAEADFEKVKSIRSLTRWKIQLARRIHQMTFQNPSDIQSGLVPVVSFGSSDSVTAEASFQSTWNKDVVADARVLKSFQGTKSLNATTYARKVQDQKILGSTIHEHRDSFETFLRKHRPDFPPHSMSYDLDKGLYDFLVMGISRMAQVLQIPNTNTLERIDSLQKLHKLPKGLASNLIYAFQQLTYYRQVCHRYHRSNNSKAFIHVKKMDRPPEENMPFFSGKDSENLARICGDLTTFHKFLKKWLSSS